MLPAPSVSPQTDRRLRFTKELRSRCRGVLLDVLLIMSQTALYPLIAHVGKLYLSPMH